MSNYSHLLNPHDDPNNEIWQFARDMLDCGLVVERIDEGPDHVEPVYLCSYRIGRTARVLGDFGVAIVADYEVRPRTRVIAPWIPLRLWLPYGVWQLRDGSEVLFSRDYKPLWRISEGDVERMAPWLWIEGIHRETFFKGSRLEPNWHSDEAIGRSVDKLSKHGIRALPRLADALPLLVLQKAPWIRDAVEMLRGGQGSADSESLGALPQVQ